MVAIKVTVGCQVYNAELSLREPFRHISYRKLLIQKRLTLQRSPERRELSFDAR